MTRLAQDGPMPQEIKKSIFSFSVFLGGHDSFCWVRLKKRTVNQGSNQGSSPLKPLFFLSKHVLRRASSFDHDLKVQKCFNHCGKW